VIVLGKTQKDADVWRLFARWWKSCKNKSYISPLSGRVGSLLPPSPTGCANGYSAPPYSAGSIDQSRPHTSGVIITKRRPYSRKLANEFKTRRKTIVLGKYGFPTDILPLRDMDRAVIGDLGTPVHVRTAFFRADARCTGGRGPLSFRKPYSAAKIFALTLFASCLVTLRF
jgi:hypothetical protein